MSKDNLEARVAQALEKLKKESISIIHSVPKRMLNVGDAHTRNVRGQFIGQATYSEIIQLLSGSKN